jgi:ankyrin repeat protein
MLCTGTSQNTGTTALFAASLRGQSKVTGILLERGADPAFKDKQGRTAYFYAKDYEIKALLTSYLNK